MTDRVSVKNLKGQSIASKTWKPLVDENGKSEYVLPEGDTNVDVWVSFDAPTVTGKPKHLQFVIVRRDGKTQEPGFPGIIGNCTARHKVVLPTGDVGLVYHWGLYSDGKTPLAVYVMHDGAAGITLNIDGYEAHYKHVPEVVVK